MIRCLFLLLLILWSGCANQNTNSWRWKLDSRSYSPPLIDGAAVYVISQRGTIIAGDYLTGNKLWTLKLKEDVVAGPATSNDSLFVASHRGTLYSLNKKDGKLNWRKTFPEGFEAPLSTDGDLILAPSVKGTLLAVDAKNGSIRWSNSGNQKFSAAASFHGSSILIGGWNQNFLCLDKADGAVRWRFHTSDKIVEQCIVYQNFVFVPARDRFIYALDSQTGRLLWRCPSSLPTGLSITGDKLVFASGDNILTVQTYNGSILKDVALGSRIDRIYVSDGNVLAVSDKGQLLELTSSSQKPRNLFPENYTVFRLAQASGILIITSKADEAYSVPYLSRQ